MAGLSLGLGLGLASVAAGAGAVTTPPTVPAAITLTGYAGNGAGYLSFVDGSDGNSPILGYKVWEGSAPGVSTAGTPTFMWYEHQVPRSITNGTTKYYKVAAVNAVGTGPVSNEISITPAANLPGALRLSSLQGFKDDVWAASIHPEITVTGTAVGNVLTATAGNLPLAVGSVLYGVIASKAPANTTIITDNGDNTYVMSNTWPIGISQGIWCYRGAPTAVSDDDTVLAVNMTTTGMPEVTGTFTTVGRKRVTVSTVQGGVTQSFDFYVDIETLPAAATAADVLASAQKVRATYDNRATFVSSPASPPTVTVGASAGAPPIGNTQNVTFNGNSGPVGRGTAINYIAANYRPTASNVTIFDPITGLGVLETAQNNWNVPTNNTIQRFKMFKSKFAVCLATTAAAAQVKGLYSDDEGVTINLATPRPVGAAGSTGNHWVLFDFGANPATFRLVELQFPANCVLATVSYDFEAGDTPVAADWPNGGLKAFIDPDSYAFGQGPWNFANGMARIFVQRIGGHDIFNHGFQGLRISYPFGDIVAGVDRGYGNYLGYNEYEIHGPLHVMPLPWTINDQAQPDMARLKRAYKTRFLRARKKQPNAIIIGCIGLHPPDNAPSTAVVAAYVAAASEFGDNDHGFVLINGNTGKRRYLGVETNTVVPGPWINAPGTANSASLIGTSQYYPSAGVGKASGTFTGSITSGVLQFESFGTATRLEADLALSGAGVTSGAVIVGQIDATHWQLYPPWVADVGTITMTATADNPHPNTLGHALQGNELGDTLLIVADAVIAMAGGGGGGVPANAALNEDLTPMLAEDGSYMLKES